MRVAVLPREVAARVITGAVSRAAWAVNAVSLALTIPALIEYLLSRDLAAALPGPLAILLVLMVLAIAAVVWPRPEIVASFLLLAASGAVLYQVLLLGADPAIGVDARFLLNRPAVSLVLVGVQASDTLVGISWTLLGFIMSSGVGIAVEGITGMRVHDGWGALLVLIVYVTVYVMLATIQARQRRLVPNLEQLEHETRRNVLEEKLRARVAATVHDTLLNDLSVVINGPDTLDARAVSRLREDVRTLTSAEWLTESEQLAPGGSEDGELRNAITMMISDLQWRGLTVRVTGGSDFYRVSPEVSSALIGAIRASLENVLRHSGVTVAEVDIAYAPGEVTVIVSDQGTGFDPDDIAPDRLGVRYSITGRVEAVGGTVRVWSSPGAGTSVVCRVPLLDDTTAEPPGTDDAEA